MEINLNEQLDLLEEENILLIDLFKKIKEKGISIKNAISYINELISNYIPINLLESLQKIYSSAEIYETNNEYVIKKKPITLMIKCFNTISNVNTADITEFIETISNKEIDGCIILSHKTGIVDKYNYQIDSIQNKTIIYIHDLNNDCSKISVAVDIIESMKKNLMKTFTNKIWSDINDEFLLFNKHKELFLVFIKEQYTLYLDQINKMELPILSNYITNKQQKKIITCSICNLYTSYTLKGIAAHKRGCIKKTIINENTNEGINEIINEIINEDINENENEIINESINIK